MRDWLDAKRKLSQSVQFDVCRIEMSPTCGLMKSWQEYVGDVNTGRQALYKCILKDGLASFDMSLLCAKGTNTEKIQKALMNGYRVYGIKVTRIWAPIDNTWYRVYAVKYA